MISAVLAVVLRLGVQLPPVGQVTDGLNLKNIVIGVGARHQVRFVSKSQFETYCFFPLDAKNVLVSSSCAHSYIASSGRNMVKDPHNDRKLLAASYRAGVNNALLVYIVGTANEGKLFGRLFY